MHRLLRVFALFVLLATPTFAHENPVLIKFEEQEVRFDAVFERFQISVRGIVQSQGGMFDPSVIEQFYGFMPQYLEQRASEIVLLETARLRGVELDEAALDARIAELALRFPGEGAFLMVIQSSGLRDVDQLRELLAEEQLIEGLFAALERDVQLSEEEVQEAYLEIADALVEPETACASHILVTDEAEARALAQAVRDGTDFAVVAANNSIDTSSAIRGGDLGCFPRGMMVAPFEEAVFSADIGVPTLPVQTQFGWHIIVVASRDAERTIPLEEIRELLEVELKRERVNFIIQALIENAGVLTFPEAIPDYSEVEAKQP